MSQTSRIGWCTRVGRLLGACPSVFSADLDAIRSGLREAKDASLTTPSQCLDRGRPRSSTPDPNFMSVVDVRQAEPQWRAEYQRPSGQTT